MPSFDRPVFSITDRARRARTVILVALLLVIGVAGGYGAGVVLGRHIAPPASGDLPVIPVSPVVDDAPDGSGPAPTATMEDGAPGP